MNDLERFTESWNKYQDPNDWGYLYSAAYHQQALTGILPDRVSDWFNVEVVPDGEGEEAVWKVELTRQQDYIDLFHFRGNGTIKLSCNAKPINEWTVNGELIVSPLKFGQSLPSVSLPYGLTLLKSDTEFSVRYYRTVIIDKEKRKKAMMHFSEKVPLGVNEKGEHIYQDWGTLCIEPNILEIEDIRELNTNAPCAPPLETGEN
jgi:hypothetical protein